MLLDASDLIVAIAASAAGLAGMYVDRGRAALLRAEKRRPGHVRRSGTPHPPLTHRPPSV